MDAPVQDEVEVEAGVFLGLDQVNGLVLRLGDERYCGLRPVRCFPLSDPLGPISLCDHEGKEVFFISRLEGLPGPARALLEQELKRHEFVPIIERILSIEPDGVPCTWEVVTDRGKTTFILQSEGDVRPHGQRGLLIVDSRGIRFLIPDVRRLDRRSRRLLAPYR